MEYDKKNHQILSKACLNCKDPYFQPGHLGLPTVGCCSYSPVISLFEIYQMIKHNDHDFFINQIYNNRDCTVYDEYIVIRANVHPNFYKKRTNHLSTIEKADLKLSFSVCQFFETGRGCALPPQYKNATCRSFICSTIEDQLEDHLKKRLNEWTRSIQWEVKLFNDYHKKQLQKNGLSLIKNVEEVISYIENIYHD